MRDFYKGVSFYTKARITIEVAFPESDICCFHCPHRYKDSGDRQMCRLMNKELYYIKQGVHEDCPLEFDEVQGE